MTVALQVINCIIKKLSVVLLAVRVKTEETTLALLMAKGATTKAPSRGETWN